MKNLKIIQKEKDFVLAQKHKFWITWNKQTQCGKLSQKKSDPPKQRWSHWPRTVMPERAKKCSHEHNIRRKMPIPVPKLLPLILSTRWWPGALHVTEFLTSQGYQILLLYHPRKPSSSSSCHTQSYSSSCSLPLPTLTKVRVQPFITVRRNLFKQQLGTHRIKRWTMQDKEDKQGLELPKQWLKNQPSLQA